MSAKRRRDLPRGRRSTFLVCLTGARLKDDPATAAVRSASNAYGIRIPDDGLAEIGATYSALRRAVERVLEADPAAFDIAVTFGPAPAGH